jgi:hypothetical protein
VVPFECFQQIVLGGGLNLHEIFFSKNIFGLTLGRSLVYRDISLYVIVDTFLKIKLIVLDHSLRLEHGIIISQIRINILAQFL